MYGEYPDNPAFQAALDQARQRARASAANRARQQAHAPDPPESGPARGSAASSSAARERNGSAAAVTTPQQPHRPQMDPTAVSSSERNAAAATAVGGALLHRPLAQIPLHTRLGLGHNPLFDHFHLTDLQNRINLQRQAERAAILGAVSRPPAWSLGLTPGQGRPLPDLHSPEAAAEEQWRARHGLPPLSSLGLRSEFRPGPVAHLPSSNTAGSGGVGVPLMGATGSPALVGRSGEVEERSFPAVAAANSGSATEASSSSRAGTSGGSGNALFDLLATAAEDTLRREEQQKMAKETEEDPKASAKPASKPGGRPKATNDPPTTNGDSGASARRQPVAPAASAKHQKRKRKGVNEPKNPLGAFVFYQRKIMADVFEENPLITFGEAAAECGRRWRALPDDEKHEYKEMAAQDKARYTRELATFKGKHKEEPQIELEKPSKTMATAATTRRKKEVEIVDYGIIRKEPRKHKTALSFFKAEEEPRVLKEFPHVSKAEASAECAARYRALSKAEKAKYEKMSTMDKTRYKKELEEHEQATAMDNINPETAPRRSKREEKRQAAEVSVHKQREEGRVESDGEEMEKAINHWSPQNVQVPSQVTYDHMVDGNAYYVEEESWRYHNPPLPPSRDSVPEEQTEAKLFTYVSHEDLRPLPPPPPLPALPTSPFCNWSFDKDTRVLYADFRRPDDSNVVVSIQDETFLVKMFERDDITVITEGLISGLDKEKWTLDMIDRVAGDEYYHKFRRFDKKDPGEEAPKQKPKKGKTPQVESAQTKSTDGHGSEADEIVVSVKHGEIDRCLSMKVKDYITYLRRRGEALSATSTSEDCSDIAGIHDFTFKDHDGTEHTIDVRKTVLYMIDFDMVKLLPTLHADFVASFKLASILPGGAHCMMNCVNSNGRPFMGPNLYITPPGSFTHFHQDGHGTVDSGHVCFSGYNEVVMVRRLPERHKRHALRFLTGSYESNRGHCFEALYNLPHGDGLGDKPQWPDNEALDRCNQMNYCVSCFILRPGQCVHINKGRLHAFRKLSNDPLPPTDCHAKLRAELVKPGTTEKVVGLGKPEVLCISVAWDWMFRGVTPKGINREIVSSLECAALNRKYGVPSLAIPELCLMQMAQTLAPKPTEPTEQTGSYCESTVGFNHYSGVFEKRPKGYMPPPSVICKGIFPALQYVVKQHIYAMNVAESLKSKSNERCKRVSIASRPNAWENPLTFALDPYGNDGFFCKLCRKEISNVYLHCDGCEILLSKDFNICLECHQEKRYVTSVQMHPLNNKRHSTINHIGNPNFDRSSRCPCKNGPVCRHCNYCAGCSCRCHTWFTLHFRFFKKDDELKLLHRVKRMVGRDELEAAEEAEKRLSMAVKGCVDDHERTPFGLHGMDLMVESQFADVEAAMEEDEEEELEKDEESSSSRNEQVKPPPLPTRKSRRLSKEEADAIEPALEKTSKKSDLDCSETPDGQGNKSAELAPLDVMNVDVDDMKVTIRCRSGSLAIALQPQEGIEPPKKNEPDSAAHNVDTNGRERTKEDTETEVQIDDGGDKMVISPPEPKEEAHRESNKSDSEATTYGIKMETDEKSEEKKVDTADGNSTTANIDTKETANIKAKETSTDTVDERPKRPRRINYGKWSYLERDRLKEALEKEPDLESVERFVGTRRIPQIRSYAERNYPGLIQALRDRMAQRDATKALETIESSTKNDESSNSGKKVQNQASNNSDEKVQNQPSSDANQKKTACNSDKKVQGQLSSNSDKQVQNQASSNADNKIQNHSSDAQRVPPAAETKPTPSRRSSRRGSKRSSPDDAVAVPVKTESDKKDVEMDDDKEMTDSSSSNDKEESGGVPKDEVENLSNDASGGVMKNNVVQRGRRLNVRQAMPIGGNGRRRSTQDLSGGRKRRNSGSSVKQVDPPAAPLVQESAADVANAEPATSLKRHKME